MKIDQTGADLIDKLTIADDYDCFSDHMTLSCSLLCMPQKINEN